MTDNRSQNQVVEEAKRDQLAYESSMYATRMAANITAAIVAAGCLLFVSYISTPLPVQVVCYAVVIMVLLHFGSMLLDNMQGRHAREMVKAMREGQRQSGGGSSEVQDQMMMAMFQQMLRLQVNNELMTREHGLQMERHEQRQIAKVEAPGRTFTYDEPDEEIPVMIMPGGQKPVAKANLRLK